MTASSPRLPGAGFLLALVLSLTPVESVALASAPAQSAPALQAPALFAEGWSVGSLLGSLNNRARVVQFCMVVLAIGLFIMMKKFSEEGDRP